MADWPVVGHEWAVSLLARAVLGGRPSHAYLLSGPAQVGKTTLARAFAQALLCERSERSEPGGSLAGAPCGECRACRRVGAGRYPDLQILTADRNNIKIDQVRALQADAALSPLEGRYRVFIIREIERATAEAANALLKTLEEPAPHVILILTCARRDLVLPTIISRCQGLGLRPLPLAQVEAALRERYAVPAERAALLARLSAGRIGWAIQAHTDPDLWQERARRLDELLALIGQNAFGRLAYSEALSRHPEAAEVALALWATWWRDVLLVQHGLDDAIVNLDRHEQLTQQAGRFRPEQIEGAVADVVATLRRLHANVNARLALDVLALRVPTPAA